METSGSVFIYDYLMKIEDNLIKKDQVWFALHYWQKENAGYKHIFIQFASFKFGTRFSF